MPDWTYHPLRALLAAAAGRRRSQRLALRALAALTGVPGGFRLVSALSGGFDTPAAVTARLGATVPVEVAHDAVRALPALGAGVVEVGPVGSGDVALIRRIAAGRRCTLVVAAAMPEVAAALAGDADRVVLGEEAGLVRVDGVSVADAAAALADPAATVLATPGVLVAAGPGWFHRVAEATMPSVPVTGSRPTADPRRWPAWVWGVLVGLGMITGGVTAAAITLGPLLLWYDTDYLGWNRDRLHTVNGHLVYFVQHDRITLAGTMVAIGVLYAGLAWGGIRRGWTWSRYAYLASGAVGFPTLFYFLSSGFVEPLHVAAAVTLFPMFVLAVRRRTGPPRWTVLPDGPEQARLRAVTGQLVMIAVGAGMLAGGVAISVIGMNSVFVDTDLSFLNTAAHHLNTANPRLVPFIAHDRAGFGGALMSAAVAVILLSVWGWRRGESWVWWTLTLTAVTGFGPAVLVHVAIGYTSVEHLIPVYLGIGLTTISLCLSRPYLCGRDRPGVKRRTAAR